MRRSADDIGLLEIGMRSVQYEWLASAQLVLQQPLETHPPALGHTCRDVDARPLTLVEVNVEVIGLQDLKIEGTIVNLVLTEVLRGSGCARPADSEQRQNCHGASEWQEPRHADLICVPRGTGNGDVRTAQKLQVAHQ
jgi:hypothetical protein